MKIDAVVMRHPTPGAPVHLTKHIDAVVINAGDGTHEHPTQAILDMTSLYENKNINYWSIWIYWFLFILLSKKKI